MATLTIIFKLLGSDKQCVLTAKYQYTQIAHGVSNEEFVANGEAPFIADAIWDAIRSAYPCDNINKRSIRCFYTSDKVNNLELSDTIINATH